MYDFVTLKNTTRLLKFDTFVHFKKVINGAMLQVQMMRVHLSMNFIESFSPYFFYCSVIPKPIFLLLMDASNSDQLQFVSLGTTMVVMLFCLVLEILSSLSLS